MLKKIKIYNFYSVSAEVELDLLKGNYAYRNEMIFKNNLVNPIGIYGLNGSGKTTLLKAIYFISSLMYKSNSSEGNVPCVPHFGTSDSDSRFTFELIIDNINYRYEIHVDLFEGIMFEELTNLDKDHVYFKRDKEKYNYGNIEKNVVGNNYPILRLLGKDELQENNEISKIFDFFENIVYVDSDSDISGDIVEKNKIMDLVVKHSDDIKKSIKGYGDFPVYDVSYARSDTGLGQIPFFKLENSELNLPYFLASDGIKTHNELLAILEELPENSLILVDEIEHNLHPLIAQKIIERMNKLSIQMIFTSHNTNLLQKMRPDQIVFVKMIDSHSNYNKLSKIYPNIREINNIEKMYFGGLFDDE